MTKNDLVTAIAEKEQVSKHEALKMINSALEVMADALARGEGISLVGFGSFDITTRAARQGRNPRTGEAITIPESRSVHFSASTAIKKALNS